MFYALNMFENSWSALQVAHQSLSQNARDVHPLTPEQSRIVNHQIEREHVGFFLFFYCIKSGLHFVMLANKNSCLRWKRKDDNFITFG